MAAFSLWRYCDGCFTGHYPIIIPKAKQSFFNLSIEVIYIGEPFDPTSDRREDSEAWSERILEDMGLAPAWSYIRDANRLVFHPSNESNKGIITFLAWIGGGILLGLLGYSLRFLFYDIGLASNHS